MHVARPRRPGEARDRRCTRPGVQQDAVRRAGAARQRRRRRLDLDTAAIDRILGAKGSVNGGVYQVGVPRAEKIIESGMAVPPSMGSAIAINFQPTGGGKAAITGDFVLLAKEVNPVHAGAAGDGIEVTALHSHMLNDEPRLFFMHFWANDDAAKLANGLREALDQSQRRAKLGTNDARGRLLQGGHRLARRRGRPTCRNSGQLADEVRRQLLKPDGVLVWVDPIHEGQTRALPDPMLREVAALGPWVSAHPDTILKMGTKEVLYRTRELGWGNRHASLPHGGRVQGNLPRPAPLRRPACAQAEPGQRRPGRLESGDMSDTAEGAAPARAACAAGSMPEDPALAAFMSRCEAYLEAEGCIVDQPFQPRLTDGMIRCYMGGDKVVGFGHQLIKALIPPPRRKDRTRPSAAGSTHHAWP